MAEHTHSGRAELGAPMDYAEHDRTFAGFVSMTRVMTLATIAVVQCLVLFGLAANAFWLGVLLLLLTMGATAIGLLLKGTIVPIAGVIGLGLLFMILTLG